MFSVKQQRYLNSHSIDVGSLAPAGGENTSSSVWRYGNSIVKVWKQNQFYLEMLASSLLAIHTHLALSNLAPILHSIEIIDGCLIGIFENLPNTGVYEISQVGCTLAKAHSILETIPVVSSYPWSGFYGEYNEFSFLVPNITDNELNSTASLLLPLTKSRENTNMAHYLHRDLNPNNVIAYEGSLKIIDWDMNHPGFREDDLAMSLICLMDKCEYGQEQIFAETFLSGYKKVLPAEWASLEHNIFRSAIALASLRQGVAGWYSDEGKTSASYWPNIRHRVKVAACLLGLIPKV